MQALYLSQSLQDLGAEIVGPVGSVEAALKLIADAPEIDAAILDVNLGGEAVYPIADALAARDVPFVFASGYEREALPERYRSVDVCAKPVDPLEVGAVLSLLRH
ncbi:response regulator [Lysobacter sp. HA18]